MEDWSKGGGSVIDALVEEGEKREKSIPSSRLFPSPSRNLLLQVFLHLLGPLALWGFPPGLPALHFPLYPSYYPNMG